MAEIQRKGAKKKSQAQVAWDAVLTGISYMIPSIVGGGVLWGIAKAMGGYNIAADMAELEYTQYTLAMVIYSIGSAIFNVCVPIIGAYIGWALADKPGLAPGFAVGVISNTIKAGFLGAVVGGLIAGYVTIFLKDLSKKVPNDVSSVFPILIIPVFSTMITSLLMWYVVGVPIGWFMTMITNALMNLQGVGGFVFGAAIGAGMSTDQGGPISKAVALVANGLNADGILGPAACKMCGGMQNPPRRVLRPDHRPLHRQEEVHRQGAFDHGFRSRSRLLLYPGVRHPVPRPGYLALPRSLHDRRCHLRRPLRLLRP